MRNITTLLTAATLIVACADDPHPTAPGSRSTAGQLQPTSDRTPIGQAKPTDQVGFTKVTTILGGGATVHPGDFLSVIADCPAGTTLVSGGHNISGGVFGAPAPILSASRPEGNSWLIAINNSAAGAVSFELRSYALCAS